MVDNQEIEFPDDMSDADIQAVLQKEFSPQEPSFIGGVKEAYSNRMSNAGNIAEAYGRDEQTKPETYGQIVGQSLALGGDVTGEALKSAGRGLSALTPDAIENPLKQGVQFVSKAALNTPQGQAALSALNLGKMGYSKLEEISPRTTRNIEAAANIGLAVPVGKGLSVVGNKVTKTAKDIIPAPAPIYSSAEIKDLSSQLYKQVETAGGSLKPEARDILISKVEKAADIGGERLTSGKTIFEDMLDTLSKKKGQALTLEGVQKLDSELTGLIQKERTITGITPEGLKLQNLQDDFRDVIRNPSEGLVVGGREGFDALQQATKQWSVGKKLEEIENILEYAKKTDNPATSIKAQFRTLSKNKKRMAGYTPDERKFINKAAESSKFADFLRTTAGSRLIGSMIGSTGGAFGGGVMGAIVGAGVGAAVSGSARKGAEILQKGRVKKLQKAVSKRADIYKLPPQEAKKALKESK